MLTYAFLALAVLSSSPADPAAPAPEPSPALSAASASVAPASVRKVRYCLVQNVTGSRIPVRTCKTRNDWLQDGFDPLAQAQ